MLKEFKESLNLTKKEITNFVKNKFASNNKNIISKFYKGKLKKFEE